MLGLQILACQIKAFFRLRRQTALDFQSPQAMARYLQNEVDLRACRSAIEAGSGAQQRRRQCRSTLKQMRVRQTSRRIVEDVFRTMLNLEVVPGKTTRCSEPDSLTASVRFNGEWNGALLVQCSGSQACALTTCLMPDLIPSRVDDDVRDSIGELANMVGGNLKSLMPPGVALSLPSVVEGAANCHEVGYAGPTIGR